MNITNVDIFFQEKITPIYKMYKFFTMKSSQQAEALKTQTPEDAKSKTTTV
jgi:hypothetical protein